MTIGKIIVLAIGIFVVASLLPSAIELIEGTTTTNWSDGAVAIWGVITLVAIVAVVFYILPPAWRGGR